MIRFPCLLTQIRALTGLTTMLAWCLSQLLRSRPSGAEEQPSGSDSIGKLPVLIFHSIYIQRHK